MNPSTAVAGLSRWAKCKKVKGPIALAQLDVCRTCPTAQVRALPGVVWLSCGEPLEETDKSCGCVLGRLPMKSAAKLSLIQDKAERHRQAKVAMVPWGKTRCAEKCPQGKWPKCADQ